MAFRPKSAIQMNQLVKVVLVGDSATGKTTLCRYLSGQDNHDLNRPTVMSGTYALSLEYNDSIVNVVLWDTAGQERFQHQLPAYLHGAAAVMLVFDLSCRSTFDHVRDWDAHIRANSSPYALALVGNKMDRVDQHQVTDNEACDWANDHNYQYFETCALTGQNIDNAIGDLVREVLIHANAKPEISSQVTLEREEKMVLDQLSKCC
jgi:small GTP-binding protein